MFEEIIKAARKSNGELVDKEKKKEAIYQKPPRYNPPEKWYEKKWGIGLMLIICFPLGAILLWQNPRYSAGIKGGITASIVFLILFYSFNTDAPSQRSSYRQELSDVQSSDYSSDDTGYLRQGVSWVDENSNLRHNSKRVKVEITGNKIVMADGQRLKQIYFLEGRNAGEWGYVSESALSR